MDSPDIRRIAVLMTSHNRRDKTLACLRRLHEQDLPDGVNFDVHLVDDKSTDGTGDAVHSEFAGVSVQQGDGTLFWGGGMRLAWAEAEKGDYDAYLWLNDDTMLLPGALAEMLAVAGECLSRDGQAAVVVGSCRDPETGEHSYGGRSRPRKGGRLPKCAIPPGDGIVYCDAMNGNLVLVPREVVARIGVMSPHFTHARGDIEYGMRATRGGIKVAICPGHLAECPRNPGFKPWTDSSMPFRKRWANLHSPLGSPPREWYVYVREYTGPLWPVYFLKPYLRVLLPWLWPKRER